MTVCLGHESFSDLFLFAAQALNTSLPPDSKVAASGRSDIVSFWPRFLSKFYARNCNVEVTAMKDEHNMSK